jgi:hypothetical protein
MTSGSGAVEKKRILFLMRVVVPVMAHPPEEPVALDVMAREFSEQ